MPRLRRRALARRATDDPLAVLLGDSRGAERVLRFFRGVLRHTKGDWAGKPFEPLPFQCEIVRGLYDPQTEDGRRSIRNGLLFLPRKSGKTTLAAGIALYEAFCGGPGAQVVCGATSREQAALLFDIAAAFVDASPLLKARAVVSRAQKRIVVRATRSTFRAIAADAPTAHGLDLTCWIYDELHAAPNRELYDVLATSTGARREALGLVISTAGYDREHSILGELYTHAKRVAEAPGIDPSFYQYIAEAGPDDPWDAEETWRKTNPALGDFRSLEELRLMAERARQIPAQVAAFRRLYLNQWTQTENTWLDMAAWDACDTDVAESELAELPCFGGLDLSATTDLTVFVLVWQVGDRVVTRPWFWIPADQMREREKRDRVPYSEWVRRGLIEATPGNVIDYRVVTQRIIELAARYRVREVGFDRWGAAQVVQELQYAGVDVAQVGQGFASLSAPTKRLQELVLMRTLAHGGNPVLRWNADCMTVASDHAGNLKPVKPERHRSAKRIDGMVALVMAVSGLQRSGNLNPDYSLQWI